jgi:hypothetical protein
MQVMREEEDKFFAFFSEAKKAAEYRKHRNKVYLATLHCAYGLGHHLVSAPLIHKSYQAAYHNSSSGYYLVQQPQDIVYEPINHVPPTPVSQSSLKAGKNLIILLQLTPPPPDIHDDLSEFTPAIPNFYQRRDSQLAHAIKFRRHLYNRQDCCPFQSRTLTYSGQTHSKGCGLGHGLKSCSNTWGGPPIALCRETATSG